jgi:hypothetical protein
MVTPQQVRDTSLAGQFNALTDEQIAVFILEAELHLEATSWGDRYEQGLALLTAHLLALELAGGTGSGSVRTVIAERLGPASRTYAAGSSAEPTDDVLGLSKTRYGMRYKALFDKLPLTPSTAWSDVDFGTGDGYA